MVFAKSSTSLQPIPASLSSCSGLEVMLVDIISLRISISQFWQPIVVSANMTMLASLPVLVLALRMMYLTLGPGVQPMPFDGFLFATSRVMEAHTSSSIKDLNTAAATACQWCRGQCLGRLIPSPQGYSYRSIQVGRTYS
jgi:hypothetical protein